MRRSRAATKSLDPRSLLRPAAVAAAGLLVLLAVACDGQTDDDDDTTMDGTPPEIVHEPVGDDQPAFVAVPVECVVTDDDGVSAVTLYYRTAGTESWSFSYLYETEQAGSYTGVISAAVVSSAGVDYYIRAVDAGVPRGEAASPEDAPETFHHFEVEVIGESLPFIEDWEGGTVVDLGWTVVSDGFPDYEWEVTDQDAHTGDRAVFHGEGIHEIPALKDWLISPVLEFDGETEVAVSWWENARFAADAQVHQLYVSTGSPEPEDGDFELVADLPAPAPDVWNPSALYDLTEFVEVGEGYVAFYYEGSYPADRWFIDDVYVGEPLPRFELDTVAVDPADFGPGDAVTLTLTVANVSLVDSPPVTGTLTTGDTLLQLTGATADLGVIASGATGDGAFAFTVDAEHPDNTLIELTLVIDDGEHSWDLPFTLMMGQDSYAEVVYDAVASGDVLLTVGHGEPAAPLFEVDTEVADSGSWSAEITAEAWYLPPGPGEQRWWLEIRNEGLYPATVSGFSIDAGGMLYEATGLPVEVLALESALVFLPALAVLEATGVFTVPDPVEPGDTGVELTVELTNTGDVATAGPLTGTLTSSDPDVNNVTGVDVPFGVDALAPGAAATGDGAFGFDVDAGHVDDADLALVLQVDDGVDAYEVPVSVPVPHAHVELEDLVVDDSDGNGDGIPDRGESVRLTAAFRNTGDYDTAGEISATVAMAASSEAAITVTDGSVAPGAAIAAGDPLVAPDAFALTVDSGYLGDLIVLDVEITDGTDTWTQTYSMEVSERPWQAIPGAVDAMGDANGYMFDIAALSFKTDGEVLWIKTDSYTPFDLSTLWLTFVFYDVPRWWRLEVIYSEAKLYDDWFDGWFTGDEVIPSLPVLWREEFDGAVYSFVYRLALADIDVDGHSLRMGMHAGSCPFVYYCDTAQDEWFWLDLQNALYNQETDLLYVFTW